MKKNYVNYLFVLVFVFLSNSAAAQISQGGTPKSFDFIDTKKINPETKDVIMPFVDVERLRAEDVIVDQIRDIPWRFGQNIDVDIDVIADGTKDLLADGSKLWRINIVSLGAVSLNFLFDRFYIPPGAELFIYNSTRKDIIGAFTDFNNRDDSVFATVPLRGDNIIIEYFEPAHSDFEGILHISRVTHGYRGPHDFEKAFGGSGSCNVNVACPQSAGMENQIRSVAMLVSGGNGFCSGSLINNSNNNGTPYFLSADHCYSNPSSVVYWFNWQSATCTNPPSSPSYQSISGATNRARYSASDVWLVELSLTPPPNYNVYFSGWNRTSDNNISGKVWGIHHPSGDIKKISWSNLGVSTTTYLQNSVPGNGTHWRVTQWSDGTTTEGGSSGSPLFDSNGRIIGQLHGGYASCSSLTSDWYGKLSVSWTGGGTNATRLSNWLDPGNTGVMVLNGYDPNVPSYVLDAQLLNIINPPDAICSSGSVVPQVTIKNMGSQTLTSATVSYVLNGGSPVSVNWTGILTTGQSAIVSFPAVTFAAGTGQTFEATVSSPNGGNDQNMLNNTLSKSFSVQLGFTLPFSENFNASSDLPGCWQIIDHLGNGLVWQFGTGGFMVGTTGNYAFLNSDAYGSGKSQNSDLVTPTIDMTGYTNVTLNFSHYFRQYTGSSATLSYSINNGATWNSIQTWTVTTSNPISFSQVIPAVTNQPQVKFKWNYTGTWGYYWSVDDVQISGTPACITPGVPSNPIAVSSGSSTASLSWSPGSPAGSPIVTYSWQVRTTGGTVVTSGSTTGTSATAIGLNSNSTYNFRVNATTDCNSTSSSWSVNSADFTTFPSDPLSVSASPMNVCEGGSTQLFAGGAQGTVYWYSVSCEGTFVGTGNPIIVTPAETTTYYALNYNGHFSAECASGTVTLHPLPATATAVDGWRCGSGVMDISVDNIPAESTIDWYATPTGGTALLSGNSVFTTPFITVTTIYYAQSRNTTTGCVSSSRVGVTATVKPEPQTPVADLLHQVCEGEALHLTCTTEPGASYAWTGPLGFTSTDQNPTVSVSANTGMSGHYAVTVKIDDCESQPGTVDLQIGSVYEDVTYAGICHGEDYQWRGNTYTTTGIYTESYQSTLGCDSIYRLDLFVSPDFHEIEVLETYQNFLPYLWHGMQLTGSGIYNATYQSTAGCDSIYELHLTVLPDPMVKTLNVKVYLEGLYSTSMPGMMEQARHATAPQFGSGIADQVSLRLYDVNDLTAPAFSAPVVDLQTDGNLSIDDLPFTYNGEYYIVIGNRNSIETWSSVPVSLSGGGPIEYDFTVSSDKAYGNNQQHIGNNHFAIYGGDTNQDGVIDGSDMSETDNAVSQFQSGYLAVDVNGDGVVDGLDMSVIENNSNGFIKIKKP